MATMRVVQISGPNALVPTDPSRLLNGRYLSQSPWRGGKDLVRQHAAHRARLSRHDDRRVYNVVHHARVRTSSCVKRPSISQLPPQSAQRDIT
jgi:hypothetical protein